ncbi:MAG: polysaccharide deacetylase family protein [Firmicutes bacterium]|nr:polysaccharide deacetylase family protein [Bacillota bacterium]
MQIWNDQGKLLRLNLALTTSLVMLIAILMVLVFPGSRPISMEGSAAEAVTESTAPAVLPAQIPVLMYHSISVNPTNRLCVSPAEFARHLDWLKAKGYTSVTLKDYLIARATCGPLPAKPVIITLDDGYDDNYLAAFPLLKERGMRATVFLIVNQIGRRGYLNLDQITEMRDYGIEFGSHSMSHADLKKAGREVQRKEIRNSKQLLEGALGTEVTSFCYPSGQYNLTAIQEAKMAGYMGAVTVTPGPVKEESRVYELPRVRVYNLGDLTKNLH